MIAIPVTDVSSFIVRRVWRYQKGNQNLYIKVELTTQWSKEKVHKDQQRSTKHTHKTKDKTAYSESCCPISQYNFTTLHMIGLSEMNKPLPDMISYRMLLDVSASPLKRYCKHIILSKLILYIPKVLWQGQQVTQAKIWNTTGSSYIQVIHLCKQLSRQVSVVTDQWMVGHKTRLGQPHHYKKKSIKSVQQKN